MLEIVICDDEKMLRRDLKRLLTENYPYAEKLSKSGNTTVENLSLKVLRKIPVTSYFWISR